MFYISVHDVCNIFQFVKVSRNNHSQENCKQQQYLYAYR